MDIVHHALIGGAGLVAATHADMTLVGLAFVAGSVFPDLDVLFMMFGKRYYLRHHQEITHSILLAPLYALLLCGLLAQLPEAELGLGMYLAALAGLLLHVGLDWLNTYRISLFAPFTKRRYSADAVFFIDATALAITAVFYLLEFTGYGHAATMYFLVLFVYLAGRYGLRRYLAVHLNAQFIIPTSLNPFAYFVLEAQGDAAVAYVYNVLSGRKVGLRFYPAQQADDLALAAKSTVFRDMQHISRAFRIVESVRDGEGCVIRAVDVAVPNFGGRFGRTELRYDMAGNLIHEMANI